MRYTDQDFGSDFDLDGELEDASDLFDRDSEKGDDNFWGLGLGFRSLTEGNVLESCCIISAFCRMNERGAWLFLFHRSQKYGWASGDLQLKQRNNCLGAQRGFETSSFVMNTLQPVMPNGSSAPTHLNRYNMSELLKCDRSPQWLPHVELKRLLLLCFKSSVRRNWRLLFEELAVTVALF
ncbi:hypothetical protein TB2_027609 [Malus domestica]